MRTRAGVKTIRPNISATSRRGPITEAARPASISRRLRAIECPKRLDVQLESLDGLDRMKSRFDHVPQDVVPDLAAIKGPLRRSAARLDAPRPPSSLRVRLPHVLGRGAGPVPACIVALPHLAPIRPCGLMVRMGAGRGRCLGLCRKRRARDERGECSGDHDLNDSSSLRGEGSMRKPPGILSLPIRRHSSTGSTGTTLTSSSSIHTSVGNRTTVFRGPRRGKTFRRV